jgi:hypothetical protein
MYHFLVKLKLEANITNKSITPACEAMGCIPKKPVQVLEGAYIA